MAQDAMERVMYRVEGKDQAKFQMSDGPEWQMERKEKKGTGGQQTTELMYKAGPVNKESRINNNNQFT